MPDKIVEDVPKETKDPKKPKETKAKISKIEAKVTDAKATENGKKEKEKEKENIYDKKASEDKIGKCPACNVFHYYISRRGSNKGQSLASAFLTACPKYINAAVEARATIIVDNKAFAVCMDRRHKQPNCLLTRPKPCKETGCTGNLPISRHGSKTLQ